MRSGAATDGLVALAPEHAIPRGPQEILLRIGSAAVLAPLGLWAVWSGGWGIILASGLCAIAASVEWTRMAAQVQARWSLWALYGVMTAGAVLAVWVAPQGLERVALVCLGLSVVAAGVTWAGKGSISSMAFGAIYVSLPFGAFVWIRELAPDGRLILVGILAIVWTTDIAAYFAGRGFGGPLLSPRDSPNKTWTGAIGAVVCACLAGAAVARLAGGPIDHWIAASLMLSVVAQGGDLLESRFKRLYGVKDTSGIVPGHGGVLDRLDALMAAVVVSALVIRFLPSAFPGFAVGAAP